MDFHDKGRHVRRLRKNRLKEALCMGGWDNCADEAFLAPVINTLTHHACLTTGLHHGGNG